MKRLVHLGMGSLAVFLAASTAQCAGAIGAIKKIDFTPGKESSLLVLNYTGTAAFRLFQNNQTRTVIVEAENLDLPASLTRAIDASTKEGPVMQITPYNSGDSHRKIAKLVLQLRQNAEATKTELPGRFVVEIRKKSMLGMGEVKFDRRDEISSKASANEKSEEIAKKLVAVLDAPPEDKVYFGSRVTFEASQADVHDIFRLVGDSSGLNIITDSDVNAKANFSVKDIPWDQLLDLVIQQASLKALVTGNVVRIIQLDKYLQDQKEKLKQIAIGAEMEPVIMSVIPLSFAKAEDMQKMITTLLVTPADTTTSAVDAVNQQNLQQTNLQIAAANNKSLDGKTLDTGILPKISQDFKRGHIEVDGRSNSLVVTNTKDAIERIRRLVKELDVPLPQVLIDAKVVIAKEDFAKHVGFQWAGKVSSSGLGTAALGAGFNRMGVDIGQDDTFRPAFRISNTAPAPIGIGIGGQLGAGRKANLAAALALAESNNVSKTVAAPRVIVNNKSKAQITDGQTIYVNTTAGANASGQLASVKANLDLSVTPQVTNSGSVLLTVDLTKDAITSSADSASPSTDNKKITTEVMVENGGTLVLGGVYQFVNSKTEGGIPLLKDLPFLGQLFRDNTDNKTKQELMVFITPQIIAPTGYAEGPNTGSTLQ